MGAKPGDSDSMNPEDYRRRNPFPQDAGWMCSTLVEEILQPQTWDDIRNIVDAIIRIRQQEKSHTSEWEHLNPEPSMDGMA
jgi:hypothetical protein